jgi:hypothetical protein
MKAAHFNHPMNPASPKSPWYGNYGGKRLNRIDKIGHSSDLSAALSARVVGRAGGEVAGGMSRVSKICPPVYLLRGKQS